MLDPPPLVEALLVAESGAAASAWDRFLEAYSPLLLGVAEEVATTRDEAMDHYAFMLDRLRAEDFRRLRGFTENGAATFESWLTVVAKRLCIDHHRSREGRRQSEVTPGSRGDLEWTARRNLARLVAEDVDALALMDERTESPDARVVTDERRAALAEVIGQLTEADQLLLTLRFEDEFPNESIAAALGMPTRFHVHRRLKKVLGLLRRGLEQRGIHGV